MDWKAFLRWLLGLSKGSQPEPKKLESQSEPIVPQSQPQDVTPVVVEEEKVVPEETLSPQVATPQKGDTDMALPKDFKINIDYMIPHGNGNAVSKGWTSYSDRKALGVTWHWTATWDLKTCTRILGGDDALRKGEASCHYGIGRSFEEGVHQYVSLDDRSWHAGAGQTKMYDGSELPSSRYKASRNTIGIETVHIGYTRKGVPRLDDYYDAATQSGRMICVASWTEEQIALMIHVGKKIQERWPNIGPRDHHGHHDICPGRKVDVVGFPFAEVLRGIYDDESIPDVWSEFWDISARQQALIDFGYNLGSYGADGDWGRMSDAALEKFQADNGMVVDGMWDTYVCWKIHDLRTKAVS